LWSWTHLKPLRPGLCPFSRQAVPTFFVSALYMYMNWTHLRPLRQGSCPYSPDSDNCI
jgi:hypothetical protein